MSGSAIFEGVDGRFVATGLARGPWDAEAMHGGAPAALLMRALEQLPTADGLTIARVTYEFLRPALLGAMSVEASVVRPGRRVQLLEAVARSADGTEIVRARALRVRLADGVASPTPVPPPPPGPEGGRDNDFAPPFHPMFAPDAIEIKFVDGRFGGGPSTAWFRMRVALVDGEEPSALQRLAAAGDFGNGISTVLPWAEYTFINPDLTLYIERVPVGEWIGLAAQTMIPSEGIGMAEGVLFDRRGRVGRATQALLVGPR
jgi:hypothetical protein